MAAGSSSSDHPSNSTGEKFVFDLSDDQKSKFMKLVGAGVESIPESKQSCLIEELSSPVEMGKASMSGVDDSDESVVLPKSNIEPAISSVRNWFSNFEKEKGKAIVSNFEKEKGKAIVSNFEKEKGKAIVSNFEKEKGKAIVSNFEKEKGKAIVGGSGNLGQIIGRGKNVCNIEDIRNLIAKVEEEFKKELSNMPATHPYQSRKRNHRTRMLDSIEYKKVEMSRIMSIASRAGDSDKITSVEVVTEMSGIENVTADNKLQEEKFMSIPSESCDSDKITSVEVVTQMSGIENVIAELHAEIYPQSLEMSESLDFKELLSTTGPQKRQRGGLDLFQVLPPLPSLADPLQTMPVGSDYERTVMSLRTNMTVPPPQVSGLGDQLSNMHLEAAEDGREEQSEDN